MPSNPLYANPTTTTLSGDEPDRSLLNVDGVSKQQKPWSVRLAQITNPIALVNNTFQQIGFETISLNTYQALGEPKYGLKFGGGVFGPHGYPYSSIVLPVSGLYSYGLNVAFSTAAGAAGNIITQIWVQVNGFTISQMIISQVGSIYQQVNNLLVDQAVFNAGDTLTFFAYQFNTGGVNSNTVVGSVNTFANLRYLGRG